MQVVFMLVFQSVVFTAQNKEAGSETLFSRITMEKKLASKEWKHSLSLKHLS